MRIAILSNVTTDILAGMLGARHPVWTAPGFGAWMQMALSPPRELREFSPEAVFILLDPSHGEVDSSLAGVAKAKLEDALPRTTVARVDIEDLAGEEPEFYDERMWHLASQPWSFAGLKAIEGEIERLLGLMRSGAKKVLALDFDGVLWKGAIGEDGVDGIVQHHDFQRAIKALKERGVILAGLSKNNADDVAPAWSDPRMVLKEDDFVSMRIDWRDKAENLATVAKELNLGPDAFVFLDDNPAERANMAAKLPEVAVPEFPAGVENLPRFIRHVERLYFPEFRLTDEDKKRTALYREESVRRAIAANATIEDYLKSLEIRVDVHPLREEEIQRVAQLSQKTNQFNIATNRYGADEIAKFAADRDRLVLVAHSSDKFGDLGLVAFANVKLAGDKADIVDFVMSCRAMNRRIEFMVERELEERLASLGIAEIAAVWKRTPKNAPVENLFESFGYELVENAGDFKRYRLHCKGRLASH